ncbi:MAG: hypothetical protein ACFCU8_08890 [Thermosynechococcaceae cyanobacterium]
MDHSIHENEMTTLKPGYNSQASDVSVETDVFEFALLRQRTNCDRLLMTYGSLIFRVGRQIVAQGEYKSRLGSSLTSKSFAGGD